MSVCLMNPPDAFRSPMVHSSLTSPHRYQRRIRPVAYTETDPGHGAQHGTSRAVDSKFSAPPYQRPSNSRRVSRPTQSSPPRSEPYRLPPASDASNYDTPPPVPRESPPQPGASRKSVHIIEPSDVPPRRTPRYYSQSEPGHSNRTPPAPFSERAPAHPGISPPELVAAFPPTVDSYHSSDAHDTHPSRIDGASSYSLSSMPPRRNRLYKPRPQPPTPPASASPSSSSLGSFLKRTFSSQDNLDKTMYPRTRPLKRSVSSTDNTRREPLPRSRNSDTTDSSCTTSSSASTSLSSASTALTTPDDGSTSNPLEGSQPSTPRSQKLRKKRPSLPPSSFQLTSSSHASFAPNVPGPRLAVGTRKWSRSGMDDVHPQRSTDCLGRFSAAGPQDLFSAAEMLPPDVLDARLSHSLAQLAKSGLYSSSSVAALSSEAGLRPHSRQRVFSFYHDPEDDDSTAFDPYAESHAAPHRPHTVSAPEPRAKVAPEPAAERSSGFSVVTGYVDRSEAAMRRWTMAMADVPDDVLLQQLERLRKESAAMAKGQLSGRRSAATSTIGHGVEDAATLEMPDRRSSFFFGGPREMGIKTTGTGPRFRVGEYDRDFEADAYSEDEGFDSDDEDDEEEWMIARKVLFCCRELVQTERNYQARVRALLAADLSHRFATLVTKHVPALLSVSETLLAHLIEDPSAWGVSTAFIALEEELEAAFVGWSAIVGEFFTDGHSLSPSRKTKKPADDSPSSHGLGYARHETSVLTRSRTINMLTRPRSQYGFSVPRTGSVSPRRWGAQSDIGHGDGGMFTAALGTGLPFLSAPQPTDDGIRNASETGCAVHSPASTLTRTFTAAWKRKSRTSSIASLPSGAASPVSPASVPSPVKKHRSEKDQEARITIRDLAIQPTQRVMRYVLQYRDLLDHTPASSPSRGLVERAYESALRIAKKCDRAQAHVPFFQQPTQQPQK